MSSVAASATIITTVTSDIVSAISECTGGPSSRHAFVLVVNVASFARPAIQDQKNHDTKDQDQPYRGEYIHPNTPEGSTLTTVAVRRRVMQIDSFLAVLRAPHIVPEFRVPRDIYGEADERCQQREYDHDRVQHLFASCDDLKMNLSQVARSPKT
ncbi:MAG: hypothetical protein AAGD13_18415 [Pseudomonadota bacterium]